MKIYFMVLAMLCANASFSQDEIITEQVDYEASQKGLDSINDSFAYQYGSIEIEDGLATLKVPAGFKFLDAQQSAYVLTELWNNPPSETLGMLFPEDMSPLHQDFTYCVEITYSQDGYIEDEDAKELDYDDLLEEMQDDIEAANPQRRAQGYDGMSLVGWASAPYYDEVSKKLHWAKELKFESSEINTLNYDIRVLGRKGYLNLTAIGDIDMLDTFNRDRDNILESIDFNDGHRYADFNPEFDDVAAYGIGGLIAGKVLAKVGFFAVLLKFWKFIALGAVALFSGFRKKLFGNKDQNEA